MSAATGPHLARARALMALRRNGDALQELAPVLAEDPTSLEANCLAAQCFLMAENYYGALAAAERALQGRPDSARALGLLSRAHQGVGNTQGAIQAALQGVELAPQNVWNLVVLADAEMGRLNLAGARAAAERAISLDPDNPDAHDALGRVHLREKKPRLAEREFRSALAVNPDSPHILNNLGVALQRQRRRREAVHCYAEASRLDPRMHLPRRNAIGAATSRLSDFRVLALLVLVVEVARGAGLVVLLPTLGLACAIFLARDRWRRRHAQNTPKASRQIMRMLRRQSPNR